MNENNSLGTKLMVELVKFGLYLRTNGVIINPS
jgi:hypothetical protein